jgi:hypothetical protein
MRRPSFPGFVDDLDLSENTTESLVRTVDSSDHFVLSPSKRTDQTKASLTTTQKNNTAFLSQRNKIDKTMVKLEAGELNGVSFGISATYPWSCCRGLDVATSV